VPEIVARFMGI